jgi:hypothetical protein
MQAQVNPIQNLRAVLPQLATGDRSFAESLLNQFERRGTLSEKQWPHVTRLAEKAAQGEKPRETEALGDLSGILALFENASKSGLKRPTIVLGVDGIGSIKINVAGETAKVPGSLNVVAKDQVDGYGRPLWFGRILQSGAFEKSPRATSPAALLAQLRAFAERPAEVAAEHGKLTGCCCFCNRPLKDERSTEVGYGPICADKFGLPWGE